MTSIDKPSVIAAATHPIQYQAPWFQALANSGELDFHVLFFSIPNRRLQGVGFGIDFQWDIPILEGYSWRTVPGVIGSGELNRFWGLYMRNPLGLLRKESPDVLLLTGWHSFGLLQLLVAARYLNIPVMVRGDSNALPQRSRFTRMLHRLLLPHYDAFLSVGRSNRDFYLSNGVSSQKLFSVPHFIDTQRFATEAALRRSQRDWLRAQWGIPEKATCFLFVGKLETKKRLFDLLEAIGMIRQDGEAQNLWLLVVGDGELMDTVQNCVVQNGLPVTFSGFLNQSEISCAYVAADCLILPSDYGETWGLVVNEAMACGCPAIVSDRVGCGPDLIDPGITGVVFPFGNARVLAEIMKSVIKNPERLLSMGAAAERRVTDHYSLERAVDGTLRAIEHLMYNKREISHF